MNQRAANTKADRPKPTCHNFQKPRYYRKTVTTKTVKEQKENQKLFTHPVRHVEKQITPKNAILNLMQPMDVTKGTGDWKDRSRSSK